MTAGKRIMLLVCLLTLWGTPLHALVTGEPSSRRQELWRLADIERKSLEQSGALLNDPAMAHYLQSVTLRLWKQVDTELPPPVVSVMVNLHGDAVTYPNGYIILSTGMFEQIGNEDQLAIILAHELIHYARQHTVQLFNQLKQSYRTDTCGSAPASRADAGSDVQQMVNVAEYQADKEGLALFKAAGFCQAEIPALFSSMIARVEARGETAAIEDLHARKSRMQQMMEPNPAAGACRSSDDRNQTFFLSCVSPALMANAQAAIRSGDWGVAERCLSSYMSLNPDDARAYYLQGEMLRQRDDDNDANRIMACFETVLKIDPQFPPAYRALGELHFKAGEYQQAKPYFEAFLDLSPEDASRAFIEGYLRLCQN